MPRAARLTIFLVVLALIIAGAVYGLFAWNSISRNEPLPMAERCVATVKGASVAVDPDQAHYASIIAGVSLNRDLVPRAASIALATAYQESGIRNLDYGHADSLGLFQQRPSQGWGTKEQVMDPHYASNSFYRALVKVKNWRTADLNDVAQKVQRSAYPQAYRKHVANARALASALTGQTAAAFRCSVRQPGKPDPYGLKRFLIKTLGDRVTGEVGPTALTITAKDDHATWAAAQVAVANVGRYGVRRVEVGQRSWTHDPKALTDWTGNADDSVKKVRIEFG